MVGVGDFRRLAENLAAVEQADRLDTREVIRTGRSGDVLAGMKRTVGSFRRTTRA